MGRVGGELRMQDGALRGERFPHVGERRQLPVLDLHRLRRVLRLRGGLGDHRRDLVADVAHHVAGEDRPLRAIHRPSVVEGHRQHGRDEAPEPRRIPLRRGEHAPHPPALRRPRRSRCARRARARGDCARTPRGRRRARGRRRRSAPGRSESGSPHLGEGACLRTCLSLRNRMRPGSQPVDSRFRGNDVGIECGLDLSRWIPAFAGMTSDSNAAWTSAGGFPLSRE